MSRHILDSGLVYGFDRCWGYFFEKCDTETGEVLDDGDSLNGMSRSDFIGVLKEHNAPEAHCASVVMDLPF